MGEAKRRMQAGMMPIGAERIGQIQVDLKNAHQETCVCGCQYFIPVVKLFTVSAIVSPIGKELTAQQSVLICLKCNLEWKPKENSGESLA